MKKYKNIIINFSVLVVAFIISLGALELASSILYETIAPEKGRKVVNVLINGKKAQSTGNFKDGTAVSEIEVLPYYLYRNKAFSKINGVQQINSEGYRNGKEEFGKNKKDKIRIIAIGGSTTFGWLIKDYKQTWPSQLEEILNEQFGGKVEVINAGLPAGLSSEALTAFMLKDKYLNPDIVVFHNGGNDVAPLFYDEYHPDYRYHRKVSGSDNLRPGEYNLVNKSNFVKLVYAFWLKNAKLSSVKTEPEKPVKIEDALVNLQKHSPIGFKRNMDTLIRETIAIKAIPVIFPFHLSSDKVYEIIPEHMKYSQEFHPAVRAALKKNKLVLGSLARKYGVAYHEMKQDKVPLEYFFDHCHLKPEGDRVKAEFIAKHIAPMVKKIANR